ncbi:hypothetical protein BH23ACT8_BH23ACT8_17170 [soil metagenome]
MADEETLERLKAIAREEHVPLAEVIRQALDERICRPKRKLSFIGALDEQPRCCPHGDRLGAALT